MKKSDFSDLRKVFRITALSIILFSLSFLLDNYILMFFLIYHNIFIDKIATFFSNLFFIILVLLIVTFWLKIEKRERFRIKEREALWIGIFLTYLITFIMKIIFARERPYRVDLLGFQDYSFPSSHAAIMFSLIPFLKHFKKWQKILIIIIIMCVAISRLVLLKHYFSDVVGGSIFGFLIGITTYKLLLGEKNERNKKNRKR